MMAEVTEHHSTKGGKLGVVMDGNFKVVSISIDPEFLTPEKKDELEAGLKELLCDVTPKVQRAVAMKMRSSGISLPGLG
jgi:DNA-binding protein YbaB